MYDSVHHRKIDSRALSTEEIVGRPKPQTGPVSRLFQEQDSRAS